MPAKAKLKLGQPTKKNPLVVKRILKIAKSGLPLHFVAQAGDITRETLNQWRKQDPDFDRLLQAARLEAVERRWRRIEQAASGSQDHPPDWKADAWSLERVYPQLFSRPETQLSVNQSVSTGPTNIVVVGPERAAILAARHESIRNKTRELFDKVRGGNGNQAGDVDPPAAIREAITTDKSSSAETEFVTSGYSTGSSYTKARRLVVKVHLRQNTDLWRRCCPGATANLRRARHKCG